MGAIGGCYHPGDGPGSRPEPYPEPIRIFIDDDCSYLEWIAQQPEGFVLNTYRSPSRDYLLLHRSNCRKITNLPSNGIRWTVDYIKICGERAELELWASDEVGGTV